MKNTLLVLFVLIVCSSKSQNLIPQPNNIKFLKGSFTIDKNTTFYCDSLNSYAYQYVKRSINKLVNQSSIFIDNTSIQDTLKSNQIRVIISEYHPIPFLGMDESYTLKVTSDNVTITANTNFGAYRSLETLLQLIAKNSSGAFLPAVEINDAPEYAWRGLMIDVCRHWIPKNVILRNIEAMAAVKMNVLHLHLSEDQAFRIESKKHPKLHLLGNDGNYFTQNDIKEIIAFAANRGIRVIPEFDVPGHVSSWLVGYPELGSANEKYEVEKNFGVFNPSLNPTKKSTYEFLDTLFTEMSALFPDEYFHIGGDENNGIHWDENKKISKFKDRKGFKNNAELQAYFNGEVLEILNRNNKKMIGWDEIYQPGIDSSIAIQSWRGKESMSIAAKNGYPSILSNGYYLDKVFDLKTYYANVPFDAETNLSQKEKLLILGAEATMWTELVDETTIDSRIWPATIAVAERLWTNSKYCDVSSFYDRVQKISKDLQFAGVQHLSFQPIQLHKIAPELNYQAVAPFLQSLHPLKGYKRHKFIKYNTQFPLTRLVDVLYTESFSARTFNSAVINNCKNGFCKNRDLLKKQLVEWVKSAEYFYNSTENNHVLLEARALSLHIQELCELAWRHLNSPHELTIVEKDRAKFLIDLIENYKLDVRFGALKGFKIIFEITTVK